MDMTSVIQKPSETQIVVTTFRVAEKLRSYPSDVQARAKAAIMRLAFRVDRMLVHTSPDISWVNTEWEDGFAIEYEAFHGHHVDIIRIETRKTPLPELPGAFFVLRSGVIPPIVGPSRKSGPSALLPYIFAHPSRSIIALTLVELAARLLTRPAQIASLRGADRLHRSMEFYCYALALALARRYGRVIKAAPLARNFVFALRSRSSSDVLGRACAFPFVGGRSAGLRHQDEDGRHMPAAEYRVAFAHTTTDRPDAVSSAHGLVRRRDMSCLSKHGELLGQRIETMLDGTSWHAYLAPKSTAGCLDLSTAPVADASLLQVDRHAGLASAIRACAIGLDAMEDGSSNPAWKYDQGRPIVMH